MSKAASKQEKKDRKGGGAGGARPKQQQHCSKAQEPSRTKSTEIKEPWQTYLEYHFETVIERVLWVNNIIEQCKDSVLSTNEWKTIMQMTGKQRGFKLFAKLKGKTRNEFDILANILIKSGYSDIGKFMLSIPISYTEVDKGLASEIDTMVDLKLRKNRKSDQRKEDLKSILGQHMQAHKNEWDAKVKSLEAKINDGKKNIFKMYSLSDQSKAAISTTGDHMEAIKEWTCNTTKHLKEFFQTLSSNKKEVDDAINCLCKEQNEIEQHIAKLKKLQEEQIKQIEDLKVNLREAEEILDKEHKKMDKRESEITEEMEKLKKELKHATETLEMTNYHKSELYSQQERLEKELEEVKYECEVEKFDMVTENKVLKKKLTETERALKIQTDALLQVNNESDKQKSTIDDLQEQLYRFKEQARLRDVERNCLPDDSQGTIDLERHLDAKDELIKKIVEQHQEEVRDYMIRIKSLQLQVKELKQKLQGNAMCKQTVFSLCSSHVSASEESLSPSPPSEFGLGSDTTSDTKATAALGNTSSDEEFQPQSVEKNEMHHTDSSSNSDHN